MRSLPSSFPRRLYKNVKWQDEYGAIGWGREEATRFDAEVVSSELKGTNGLHAPVLDMDYATHLISSSTPGHYHLYIDKAITWRQYKRILKALAAANLIEPGYAKASIARKHSAVRVPWLLKRPEPAPEPTTSASEVYAQARDAMLSYALKTPPEPSIRHILPTSGRITDGDGLLEVLKKTAINEHELGWVPHLDPDVADMCDQCA